MRGMMPERIGAGITRRHFGVDLLDQFRAGKKNHLEAEVDSEMGFTSR